MQVYIKELITIVILRTASTKLCLNIFRCFRYTDPDNPVLTQEVAGRVGIYEVWIKIKMSSWMTITWLAVLRFAFLRRTNA